LGDSNWTALGLSAASVEELISTEVDRIISRSCSGSSRDRVILHTTGQRAASETVVDAIRRSAAVQQPLNTN